MRTAVTFVLTGLLLFESYPAWAQTRARYEYIQVNRFDAAPGIDVPPDVPISIAEEVPSGSAS